MVCGLHLDYGAEVQKFVVLLVGAGGCDLATEVG